MKLYAIGLWKKETEELITDLIADGFINEGKLAEQLVNEKMDSQWGRTKIKRELMLLHISTYCINDAMKKINEEKYGLNLHCLAAKKWNSIKGKGVNHFVKRQYTGNYLLQKGYEPGLVYNVLDELKNKSPG